MTGKGHSPFVWSTLGGIAVATERLRVGTGVTCPTIRIHPTVIAQAAATTAMMMPGRFFLGVGTGESLNEHILGDPWPSTDRRLEMLEEAVEIIRLLWKGGLKSHEGRHYLVENARIYSLPDEPPPLFIAGSGEKSVTLAGRLGDGLIGTAPDSESIKTFESAGGRGKHKIGEVQVCWGEDEHKSLRTAHEWWPNVAMSGQLGQDLALPSHYESIAELVGEDDIAELVACGPDPQRHLEEIGKFVNAGFDQVCVHQIGPDQEGMISFYENEVIPKL